MEDARCWRPAVLENVPAAKQHYQLKRSFCVLGEIRCAALGRMSASGAPKIFHFKLVLLGDASVGKSCLVVRFAKGEFYEYQEPTIGAAFMTQTVSLGDVIVKFEIWDTAGQERYKSLAPMYYRGAAAAVVVYDITSKESFEAAKAWVTELQSTDTLIALAGNKSDLDASRVIDGDTARSYADTTGILYMETSAKSGQNVSELFHEIAVRLPKQSKEGDDKGKGFSVGNKLGAGTSGGFCCGP